MVRAKLLKFQSILTSEFCNLSLKYFKLIKIVLQVLPSIVPFNFGDEELNLDESISAMCSVTKGDQPMKIWWTFQEEGLSSPYNVTTNDGIVISRTSSKISSFVIEAVQARHRGNYTCIVQNKAGTASHSAYLAINGSTLPNFKF
jgi:hypothetical protein